MVFHCNVCKKEFKSNSFEDLNTFCKHCASCPVRSNNFLVERFKCNICSAVFKYNRSFKYHLVKCHPPTCNQNLMSASKWKREEGKYQSLAYIFLLHKYVETKTFTVFHAQRQISKTCNESIRVELPLTSPCTLAPSKSVAGTHHLIPPTTATINQQSSSTEFSTTLLKVTTRIFARTNVSMDGAEALMTDISEILEGACRQIRCEVECIGNHFTEENRKLLNNHVDHACEKVMSSLKNVNTEQKLSTTLRRKKVMETLERITFNEKRIQVEDTFKDVKSEAILLPIEHEIKSFLEKAGILDVMLDYQKRMEQTNDGKIKHFLNAKIWKNVKTKFDGEVIPIFLYNDDFVPDDTRSPHGASNKISAFYSSFPSLPPKFNSTLESILVLMLAKSEEIKEVGATKVLEILSQKLKPLEEVGIKVNNQRVFIAPVLLMGDNLGMNMNLGFPMNFSKATYYCRFCFMQINQCEKACTEIESLIRTEEHYKECLKNLGRPGKNYGVVSKCDLNILKSFNVASNFSVDIMHDLLSGVFKYGIQQLLRKGIADKLFTLNDFNAAKNDFDYGSKEAHCTIENITSSNQEYSIHCHAREMWTLIKFLPYILRKILPSNHCLYKYGLMLVDLLDICFQCSFSTNDLDILKNIVTSHNKEFLRLFGNQNPPRLLTAKFHFLLHYARVIQNSGPLKNLWSMRFEAKHQHLKSQAKIMYSRRNICYSFAKKICFQNASVALNKSNIMKGIKDYSESKEIFQKEFCDLLSTFTACKKVNLHGTVYSIDDYIISDCEQFAYKIRQVAVNTNNDEVKFIVEKFAIKYDKTFRSFKIYESLKTFECYSSQHFTKPPQNSHLFEHDYYLRKEHF